jgi:hypothetical protein
MKQTANDRLASAHDHYGKLIAAIQGSGVAPAWFEFKHGVLLDCLTANRRARGYRGAQLTRMTRSMRLNEERATEDHIVNPGI